MAWLLPTGGGQLWARRDPWVERDDMRGWAVGWAEEDGPQRATCACNRSWLLDPDKADGSMRRVEPRALRPETPSAEVNDDATVFD